MMKLIAGAGALAAAYALFAQDSGYSRTVAAPPPAVATALGDLDFADAPGAPGTDPARSGGVPSSFALTREGNDLAWTVRNGDEVAVRLIAHLEPVGSDKTKVTLDYQRGNAPDDHVAPAFRSRGISLGLFAMVIEEELDRLTMPPKQWTAACDAIIERFRGEFGQYEGVSPPASLTEAFGLTAKTAMRLSALDKELKAKGCPTETNRDFAPISNEMGNASPEAVADPRVSYAPGKPMIDARPR